MKTGDPDRELETLLEFERAMTAANVRPIHPTKPKRTLPLPRRDPALDRAADAEFEAAMEMLEAPPNKDKVSSRPATPPADPMRTRIARLTFSDRGAVHAEATLDLHGLGAADVERELRQFLTECVDGRCRTVVVVTGRGGHSESGTPVVRPAVQRWLETEGRRYATGFGVAPRSLGGDGAFVVELRSLAVRR